jgi:SET domain-containing protein
MDNRKAVVRQTARYGHGVFADERISAGEVVAAFDGILLGFSSDKWTDDTLNHAIQCGPALWRDATGIARLINHSCEANCGIKDYFNIVAMRTIEPGEEITWDYEMSERSSWWRMECQCGTASCRTLIGNFDNMPPEVRQRYEGFISDWLLGTPYMGEPDSPS